MTRKGFAPSINERESPRSEEKGQMARPRKNADEALSEMLPFRMSIATRETLRSKARAAGVSEAEYLRRYIDGTPNPAPARASIDPALVAFLNSYAVALGRIGNNVNQLAHATHRGSDFTRFWRDVGQEVQVQLGAGRAALARALEAIDG
jgi:hypothetical protein